MTTTSVPEPHATYEQAQTALLGLVGSMSADDLATPVPMSPEWTVLDVVAHVTGIVSDIATGNLAGVGTQEWTAAQVAARQGRSLAELADEWRTRWSEVVLRLVDDPASCIRMTADLVVHVHDVAMVTGEVLDRDDAGVRIGLERYVPYFCERAASAGLDCVRVEVDGPVWQSTDAAPAATLSGSAFEVFRALSGRRSLAQVSAMDWAGDSAPFLDVVTPYGLPDADVVE